MHQYEKSSDADYVKIGKLPMMLIRPFVKKDDDEGAAFLKKIYKIEVLDIDLNGHEKNNVRRDVQSLKSGLLAEGYNELMYIKSEGDKVHILCSTEKNDVVRDCILLIDNADEVSVIRLSGTIKLNEIGNLSGKWNKTNFTVAED